MIKINESSHGQSHEGELEMRRRLPGPLRVDAQSLAKLVKPEISPALGEFIQRQPFFFIATANDQGACGASFRGNGFYNSLGNILQNPHIGMLFIDFSEQQRARINGEAFVEDVLPTEAEIWPEAQAIVRIKVAQAYDNCSARSPKLKTLSGTTRMVQMKRRR